MENTTTNREIVEEKALAIVFATDESAPILPMVGASKAGALSYSSVRKALKASEPNLSGDALTKRVNETVNAFDATALAGVIQMHREGFHFTKVNGRQLKNGTRNVSIAMTDRKDAAAPKAKKLEDLTAAELRDLLAAREALEKAETAPVIEMQSSAEVVFDV